MDNADDPKFHLFPYIPQSFRGNIIITTRNANHATLAPKNSHHLEGLSTEDAINLILTASESEDTPANRALARAIVEELGHLPLALAQAAGYILVHKCLSTYLDIYHTSKDDLLALLESLEMQLPHDYQASVATTIAMSLKQLPRDVEDMMRIFAHLENTSIARNIISKAASRQFREVVGTDESKVRPETLQHAEALMKIFCPGGTWSESAFNKLITQCLQYSLLRVTNQGNAQFYSMHILVQSYLQATSSSAQSQYVRQLIVRLLGSPITLSTGNEHLAFNRSIFPHLRLIHMEDVIEGGDHRAFGHVMERAGDDKSALPHFERCVNIWKFSLGEEHENTLWAIMDLAHSYKMKGTSQDAAKLEERVLEIRKRTLGLEHRNTLTTSGSLASSYTRLGEHEEAMKLNEQVLEVQKRVLGSEDVDTVLTMSNLAISYIHLRRNEEALELQKKVLELQKKSLGPEDPNTLRTMSNLADSYRRVGRSQEALEIIQQALEMEKMVVGPEHPNTLTTMCIQLLVLRDLGMTEQLSQLLDIALPVHEKVLGTNHIRTEWIRETFSSERGLPQAE
jgi:tetratricopeptide (TPR) repeat protein